MLQSGRLEHHGKGLNRPMQVNSEISVRLPDSRGPIIHAAKRAGERSAGNRPAPFEVAGAGNGAFRRLPRQSSTLPGGRGPRIGREKRRCWLGGARPHARPARDDSHVLDATELRTATTVFCKNRMTQLMARPSGRPPLGNSVPLLDLFATVGQPGLNEGFCTLACGFNHLQRGLEVQPSTKRGALVILTASCSQQHRAVHQT
jgi:hypothetical protein